MDHAIGPEVVNETPPIETEKEMVRNPEVTITFRDLNLAKPGMQKRRLGN
jgi:hypothetical protein